MYLSKKNLRKESLTTSVADISQETSQALTNSLYLHSKKTNFLNGRKYIDPSVLAQTIDNKLIILFDKAIKLAKQKENIALSTLGVNSIEQLEQMFSLNKMENNLYYAISLDEFFQNLLQEYSSESSNYTSGAGLQNLLEKTINIQSDIFFNDMQKNKFDLLTGKKNNLSKYSHNILHKINDKQKILMEDLAGTKLPQVAIETKNFFAFIEEDTTKHITNNLQNYFNNKNVKPFEKDYELKINLKSKALDEVTIDKIKLSKTSFYSKKSLQETFEKLEIDESVKNVFIYNFINMTNFSYNGGIGKNNSIQKESFSELAQFEEVLRKSSAYFIGIELLDDIGLKNTNFWFINGQVIPISDILKQLKKMFFSKNSLIDYKMTSMPRFGIKSLWDEKREAMNSLSSNFYEKGARNYPTPILRVGATIGQIMSQQIKLNGRMNSSIEKLIK